MARARRLADGPPLRAHLRQLLRHLPLVGRNERRWLTASAGACRRCSGLRLRRSRRLGGPGRIRLARLLRSRPASLPAGGAPSRGGCWRGRLGPARPGGGRLRLRLSAGPRFDAHRQRGERDLGRQRVVRITAEVDLPERAQRRHDIGGRGLAGQRLEIRQLAVAEPELPAPARLQHQHRAQRGDHLAQEGAQIDAVVARGGDQRQPGRQVMRERGAGERAGAVVDDEAEAGADRLQRQLAAVVGGRLIEQIHRIAQRARRLARDQLQPACGDVDAFTFGDHLKAPDHGVQRDAAEVEALAAGEDGGRKLVRLGGGEHEDDVGGRLLQRLQQRVERRFGEHMRFVDEVELVARPAGRDAGALTQRPHIVDAAVRGGVELDQVQRLAAQERDARLALVVGLAFEGRSAVHSPGEDAGGAGLAGAARAGEEVGVRRRAGGDGVAQRGRDRLLPHHIGEAPGPPLTV